MRRWDEAIEDMDKPDCDPALLERTYAQFPMVNRLFSGWRGLYTERIRPVLPGDRTARILDIGCGGGDIALALARWTVRDGLDARILGIDPDERAWQYATGRAARAALPEGRLEFRQAFSHELLAEPGRYDVVISNHLIHHLSPQELEGLWQDSSSLAGRLVLHSDIRRSRVASVLFGTISLPLAGTSLIRRDGLISIHRSYTPVELAHRLPEGWRVETGGRFRNLAVFEPAAEKP